MTDSLSEINEILFQHHIPETRKNAEANCFVLAFRNDTTKSKDNLPRISSTVETVLDVVNPAKN